MIHSIVQSHCVKRGMSKKCLYSIAQEMNKKSCPVIEINIHCKRNSVLSSLVICRICTLAKPTIAHAYALFHPIETVVIAWCPLIELGSIKAGKVASCSWYFPSSHRQTLTLALDVQQ